MDMVKINAKGQIKIPEAIRAKKGWDKGVVLAFSENEGKIVLSPAFVCCRCGKILDEAHAKKRVCDACAPPEIVKVY